MKRKKEVKKINSNSNKKYIKDGKKKERKASKINRKLEQGRKRIERMQNNKKE